MIASAQARPYVLTLPGAVRAGIARARAGWIVQVRDVEGRCGYGDLACWPGFGDGERAASAALPGALAALEGRPATRATAREVEGPLEVRAALSTATLDLLARASGQPLAALLSAEHASSVSVQALVRSADSAGPACEAGVTCFKLKVGEGSIADDARRALELRERVGDQAELRLDVNGLWPDAEAAIAALDALSESRPAWVEQPLRPGDVAGLARARKALRARSDTRVAVDEGLRGPADLEVLLAAEALDGVVLKPTFLGGLLPAYDLAQRARARGARVWVTHALDSAIGRATALHLAAACADEACGLWPPFEADLAALPPVRSGRLALPRGLGLGLRLEESWAHLAPAANRSPLLSEPVTSGPKESP